MSEPSPFGAVRPDPAAPAAGPAAAHHPQFLAAAQQLLRVLLSLQRQLDPAGAYAPAPSSPHSTAPASPPPSAHPTAVSAPFTHSIARPFPVAADPWDEPMSPPLPVPVLSAPSAPPVPVLSPPLPAVAAAVDPAPVAGPFTADAGVAAAGTGPGEPSPVPVPAEPVDLREVPGASGLSQEQIQALANISFDQINEVYSQRMAEALAIYQAAMDQYTKERDFALTLILQRNAARSQQILGQLSQLTLG